MIDMRKQDGIIVAGAVLFVSAFIAVGFRVGLDPGVMAGVVPLLVVVPFLLRRYPALIVAALLYVGNYKTQAAAGFGFTDPTFLVAALTGFAIALRMLFIASGRERVSGCFLSQGKGAIAFVFFVLVLALSFLYTSAPVAGADKLLKIATIDSMAFFAPLFLFRNERDFEQFIWLFVLLSLPIAIRVIFNLAHPSQLQLAGEADITMIGDAGLLGGSIIVLLYHRLSGRVGYWLLIAGLPLLALGMIASAARGPLLSLVLVVLYSTVFVPAASVMKRSILVGALAIMFVIGTAAFFWVEHLPVAQNKLPTKIGELQTLASGSLDVGGTAGRRLDFFRSAIDSFRAHPFGGLGLAGWGVAYYGEDKRAFPHNFVLEVAAEQGALGLLALGLLFAALFRALRIIYRDPQRKHLFLLQIFAFVTIFNLVTGDIENRGLFMWWGLIFVAARIVYERARASEPVADTLGQPQRRYAATYSRTAVASRSDLR